MVQPRAISLSFAAARDDVPRMRRFVARWLQESEIPEPERSDLLLATAEAINNACEHASPPGCSIHISCVRRGSQVVLSISDRGNGFCPDPHLCEGEPPLEATCGRGVFLMQRLADQVAVKTTTRGTTVTLVRDIFA